MLALTEAGRSLLTAVIAGDESICFVRIEAGNGENAGASPSSLSAVQITLPIEHIEKSGAEVVVEAHFNNEDVEETWHMTELGLYARGTEENTETILYAYEYTSEGTADVVPAHGDRTLETTLRAVVYVGDAANATVEIRSGIYATQEELAAHRVTAGCAEGATLGELATAEGEDTEASGDGSHAEGLETRAAGAYAHAEGYGTRAEGNTAHAEGSRSRATASAAHAEGTGCIASANASHAEGWSSAARAEAAHAEGGNTTASGEKAHAEGAGADFMVELDATVAAAEAGATSYTLTSTAMSRLICVGMYVALTERGTASRITTIAASGGYVRFETESSLNELSALSEETSLWARGGIAGGTASHAEGVSVFALGEASHAEGEGTEASGLTAHAEGKNTKARGNYARAAGRGTIAKGRGQSVFGEFNEEDPTAFLEPTDRGEYVEIVGNGSSSGERGNARTLDWGGNEKLKGSITVGAGSADEATLTGADLTALLQLLNEPDVSVNAM